MSQTIEAGLLVPNQDGSDHTREWEHAAGLARSVGKRLPRIYAGGVAAGGTLAPAGSVTIPKVIDVSTRGFVGELLDVEIATMLGTGTSGAVNTVQCQLINITGATLWSEELANPWRIGVPGSFAASLYRRRIVLAPTTPGTTQPITADLQILAGTGASSITYETPRHHSQSVLGFWIA